MKVALIPFHFPVVSETFVSNIAAGLLERGHAVDVFPLASGRLASSVIHPAIGEFDLLGKTHYSPQFKYLGKEFNCPRLVRFWISGLRSTYDIVHFQFGEAALQCLAYQHLSFFRGKWVVSFRGYDISSFVKRHGTEVYRALFKRADLCLSNSEFFRERLIALGCQPRKAMVYRSGIDCSKFAYVQRKDFGKGPLKIVSVGRLVEKKGVEFALLAIAQLIKDDVNVQYEVVGDGPLRGHLESLIRSHQLSSHVRLLGSKDQTQLIEILNHAHIYLSSGITASDGDENGPDNTIKEAMAIGLPVIASRCGAIAEVVEDGQTGLLVEEQNVPAIVSAVKFLQSNPSHWIQMTRKAREFVETNYNLNQLTSELIAKYEALL